MELWIRSQDKEKLLKVNDIAIEMNMVYGYFDKNTEYEHLGSYASRERALKVLDEIQNVLNPKAIMQQVKIDEYELKLIPEIYVYEMPEE